MIDACPRCTYSQVGLPLQHACPECGLRFDEASRVWRCPPVTKRTLLRCFGLESLIIVVLLVAIVVAARIRPDPLSLGLMVVSLLLTVQNAWSRWRLIDPGRVAATLADGLFVRLPDIGPRLDAWPDILSVLVHVGRKGSVGVRLRGPPFRYSISGVFQDRSDAVAFAEAVQRRLTSAGR